MIRKSILVASMAALSIQAQAGDPLKVVRDKGFYKTGAAAKNRHFTEWLKKPLFGEESVSESNGSKATQKGGSFFGLLNSHPLKVNTALQTIRDQGYKDKEARMRAEAAKKRAQSSHDDR